MWKLALNYFGSWKGAAFIDAGNIWTIKAYKEQPEGRFQWSEFYNK